MSTEPDFTQVIQNVYFLTAQEGLQKAKIERTIADIQRKNLKQVYREMQRPWRQLGAVVEFDSEKNQWKSELWGVAAWGDTPEMACDNFDHLWMYGK